MSFVLCERQRPRDELSGSAYLTKHKRQTMVMAPSGGVIFRGLGVGTPCLPLDPRMSVDY